MKKNITSSFYSPALKKKGGAILDLPCPSVIRSFRNLSNENFSLHFSQELWGLEDWNLVHTWTVGRCVYRNRAAAAYLSLYFFIYSPALKKWGLYWICLVLPSFCDCHSVIQSFCHSVTFQMKTWNLVHTWIVGRCIVHTGIRLLLLICPFISSFFFLQFSNIKNFCFTFLRNCEA